MAIGYTASASATQTAAVGYAALASGNSSTTIGTYSNTNNQAYAICIGNSSNARTANSVNIGSAQAPARHMFLGMSEYYGGHQSLHVDSSIRPTRPQGLTNANGGGLNIMGAGSTGTGLGGSVRLQTVNTVSASGSTTNTTWATILEANAASEVIMYAKDAATADASLWANSLSFYLDETGNTVTVKAKYADGTTIKTGTISLT